MPLRSDQPLRPTPPAAPRIEHASLIAAALSPLAAYGSFGGAPCRTDFACHFGGWGLLIGIVGVPLCGALLALLHMVFCHPARSKRDQFLLGGFLGAVAYEVAAAVGSLLGASGMAAPGNEADLVLAGLVATFVLLAALSVLYARSNPRHPSAGTPP